MTPKSFFISLGVLVTLVASVASFLNLIFDTLEKKFPDALNATYQYGYSSYNFESVRSALATLIIVFPIFLLLSYFFNRLAKDGLGRIDLAIRKWMIYLILFLAAVIVVVDLVTLVRYFVAGEITLRFILKVVTVLFVALVAGSYYTYMLEVKPLTLRIRALYAGLTSVIVLAAIIWSFCVIGTPGEQRMWRLDDRRVQDLQSIQWQVINYWQQKEKLPESLSVLSDPISSFMVPVDPEFEKGNMYEYSVTGPQTFSLCATFSAPMPVGWQEYNKGGGGIMYDVMERDMAVSYPYPGGGGGESWDHEAGHTCFSRTIDPEIYPPYPDPVRDLPSL